MARWVEPSRMARPSPPTSNHPCLLSTPHPALCATFPASRRRGADMFAYLVRRLLLMIPTILGIMAVSFAIVQFVPGGPVERAIAQLQGAEPELDRRVRRRRRSDRRRRAAGRRRHLLALSRLAGPRSEVHQGAGEAVRLRQAGVGAVLDPGARLRDLPFRQELLPRHARPDADRGEAAGFDLARPVDDVHLLRDLDPARHPQGGQGRFALRHRDVGDRHLRLRDPELPVRGASDRAVLRRLVLADLSARAASPPTISPTSTGRTRFSTTSGTSPCR